MPVKFKNIVKCWQNKYRQNSGDFILLDKDGIYYFKRTDEPDWETREKHQIMWPNLNEITKAEFFAKIL